MIKDSPKSDGAVVRLSDPMIRLISMYFVFNIH